MAAGRRDDARQLPAADEFVDARPGAWKQGLPRPIGRS